MEQIGHLQWTLGIILMLSAILSIPLSGWDIFILGWMAHFPDLIDLLWGKRGFATHHRYITHSIWFLLFWYLLAIITGIRILWLIAIGSTFHIAEDIFAGGMYIEFLAPLSRKYGRLMLFTKEHQAKIGGFIKRNFGKSFLGTNSLADELAFYWLIVMIGSWLFVGGLISYYLRWLV